MTTRVLPRRSARRGPTRALFGMAFALSGGCAGAGPAPDEAASSRAMAEPVQPPATGKPAGATSAVPADLIGIAVSDAARRAATARDQVKVVTAEAVTWSDGALGCPQPGMLYTQALVPGYRIVLEAGGQTLNYHAGAKSGPVFCPAERVIAPAPGGAEKDLI